MIIEGVTGLGFWVINMIFSGFEIISLPVNYITVLINFMKYGAWVVGSDLIAITFATIFFWMSFKAIAGLVVFVWKLLPLT